MAVTFAPGPQDRVKYGNSVGPNYLRYGEQEQNGYVYIPQYDKYYVNPKKLQEDYQNRGIVDKPKEPASLASTLGPIALTMGAVKGAEALVPGVVGSIKDGTGLLGVGSKAYEAGKTALGLGTATAPVATTTATGAGGLVGAGAPAAPTILGASRVGAGGAEAAGAAGAAEAGGAFSIGGIGTAGNAILPIAGAAGMTDVIANKKHGKSGAMQGAASGAAIGSYFPGYGTVIGAVVGGTLGYFGNFGDKDRYKTEWNRKKKLFDKGIISQAQLGPQPTKGKSKAQLIAEAKATGGNLEFAQSRNEGSLRPIDIQGYAQVLEKAHELKMSPLDVAAKALAAQAVREHHGTIDIDFSKVNFGATPPPQAAAQPAPIPPGQDPNMILRSPVGQPKPLIKQEGAPVNQVAPRVVPGGLLNIR